jgi:LmbE family N-acetylglucosaminyl deacetylase
MGKPSVMAVAAHCDDVEFCFASTLLKYHEKEQYAVWYVQSTNNMSGGWAEVIAGRRAGLSPLPAWITEKQTRKVGDRRLQHQVPWYHEIRQRKTEAANAARDCFGTEPIHLDYAQRHYWDRSLRKVELRYGAPAPDCYDPDVPTIMTACEDPGAIERVANLILEKDPEVVLTHPAVDYTFEHTGTTLLVQKAFDLARSRGYDGSLLLRSATPALMRMGAFFGRWDSFIDTTGFLARKREAIGKHACQVPEIDGLDLFDTSAGALCGGCESAETYTVVELSETRTGALTEEFARNHDYCNRHWMELFFSERSKQAFSAFEEQYRRHNGLAAPRRKKAAPARRSKERA